MSDIADKFISRGGRTAEYSRTDYVADMVTAASFLAWAEDDGAMFGGETAKDAFMAFCRLLDVPAVKLRKTVTG